jgi:hypothetical protein
MHALFEAAYRASAFLLIGSIAALVVVAFSGG